MIYIGYVTMKLFVVCHTVPFLETNVSVLGLTGGRGSAFYGDRFRSKIVIFVPSKCLQQHVPF